MKVKAVVILDVEDVSNWEDAYASVFALANGPAIHKHVKGKFHSAYLRKVVSVESAETHSPVPGAAVRSDERRCEG